MSKGGFYQRDYNILNFEPLRMHKNASVVSEPTLPRIAPASNKPFNKNFSTIKIADNQSVPNSYPFENVVNAMREKKKYDPLMESKINTETKYDKNSKPTLFNASSLDYNFISFTKKKDPETIESIHNVNPKATFKRSAVSEFAHIGRVTSPNFNDNFKNVYGKDQTAFRLRNGMGGQYLDSLKTYGGIADCFKRAGK